MKLKNTTKRCLPVLEASKEDKPKSRDPHEARGISVSEMKRGRDEMNLAEFPLSGLASGKERGKDTLVFEEKVADKERGGTVKRRLTVSPSVEYGLPTPLDDEAILGLVQLAKASEFSGRKVNFVPADLFRVIGWREDGRSYSRLETSLMRWLGITLYYNNAWWDRVREAWVDEHFHLLEHVVIRRRRCGGSTSGMGEKDKLWSVTWNDVVFRSFEAGYLKTLDMELYRKLRLPASKRIYRFLDKRLHYRRRKSFELRAFACERIGFSRLGDNSQLKRHVNRATDELQEAGFLEPIPKEDRYQKVCRGKWEVVFERKRRGEANGNLGVLEAALTKRGIWSPVAVQLVRDHPAANVEAAIREFDELMGGGRGQGLGNPPGLLVSWINERCEIGARKHKANGASGKDDFSGGVQPCERKRDGCEDASVLEVKEYLGKLSVQELQFLEAEALSQAKSFLAEGYRRSLALGSEQLISEYREMILNAHVTNLLGQSRVD